MPWKFRSLFGSGFFDLDNNVLWGPKSIYLDMSEVVCGCLDPLKIYRFHEGTSIELNLRRIVGYYIQTGEPVILLLA
jgi:hypothetical protein